MVTAAVPTMKECPTCHLVTDAQWFCRNCGEFLRAPGTSRNAANLWRRFWAYVLDYLLFWLLLIIGWFIWFGFFTAKQGQTPGKQLLGLRVIKLDGAVPDTGTMWLRAVVIQGLVYSFVGALAIVAYLWAFFDRDRQTLHDKMLGTYVIHHPGPVEEMVAVPVTPEEQFGPQIPTGGAQHNVEDAEEALRRLAKMRDDGLVTAEEYEQKRGDIVGRM
jgi:uncharacterized RDD family membrane protein YckC